MVQHHKDREREDVGSGHEEGCQDSSHCALWQTAAQVLCLVENSNCLQELPLQERRAAFVFTSLQK